MVEIISRNGKGEWVIQSESQTLHVHSLKAFFETRLAPQGATLAGRLKSTVYLLNRYRNTPLWLESNTYFMVIPNHQSPERIYINGASVKTIHADKERTFLTFTSGHTCIIQIPFCKMKVRLNRLLIDIRFIQEISGNMDSKAPW